MNPPTSLPSAKQLAEDLVERGYGEPGFDLEQVAEWCSEHGDELLFARALPSAEWRARQPNDCHMVLAELAAERLIQEILTTNWDTMLEMALNRCAVPYQCVEEPSDLAADSGRAVQVIKLHGGIEAPNTIRARKSDVDSEEWAADWAAAVFAVHLRAKSVLFAGYSGASRATTRTIERISAEESRTQPDWIVGRHPLAEAVTQERLARLLEALGSDQGGYIKMDATEFFGEVREGLYPLLLARPKTAARQLLTSLLAPTEITPDDVLAQLASVSDTWRGAGQQLGQKTLRHAISRTSTSTYAPIIPNSQQISGYWSWIAMVSWAGAARLDPSTLEVEVTTTNSAGPITVVPVLCRSGDARSQAEIETRLALAQSVVSPSVVHIGVVVGGTGPLRVPPTPFSVARGIPAPDVVRGGEVRIEWTAPGEVFDLAVPGTSPADVAEAIRSRFAEIAGALAGEQ